MTGAGTSRTVTLDALRGLGALLVLVSHVGFWSGATREGVVGGLMARGDVGVALFFALSAFLSPVISAIPSAATAGVLVVVGCMMASSLKEIDWSDISEAVPAFFASVFMAFSYSISYGIAGGFITYCLIKTCKGKAKEVHPVIWVVSLLFILDFVITAIL